jgi:hypothetical protein
VLPYLNGEDLNSRPDQSPSRWVINFQDWPLSRTEGGTWQGSTEKRQKEWLRTGLVPRDYPDPVAADYPICLKIVEEKVKPERQRKRSDGAFVLRKPLPQRWWHYAEKRPALYATIAQRSRVLVVARTAKYRAYCFTSTHQVLDVNLVVFAMAGLPEFAVMQSNVHEIWVNANSSTLETRQGYRPSDCFETFPFPVDVSALESVAEGYSAARLRAMETKEEGLTKIYNRLHDPQEIARDIGQLRDLQASIDLAVAQAYGWTDLQLRHDFYEVPQGVRFTVSDHARREVLARLFQLNHERYSKEVSLGLHEERRRVHARGHRTSGGDLFSSEEEE